jgi:hypothetical protein
MPVGNGRSSANVWVDVNSGDLMLLLGLADAFDENSNLLKLGRVRIRFDPPLFSERIHWQFQQALRLDSGTIEITTDLLHVEVWVDSNTSTTRVRYTPTKKGASVAVVAVLENWRLNGTIDAGKFGNGWGGSGGSFCYDNGTIANSVFIYPDQLIDLGTGLVGWLHRNDAERADHFSSAMREQGLGELVGDKTVTNPLVNRTFGAAMRGTHDWSSTHLVTVDAFGRTVIRRFYNVHASITLL